MMKYLLDTCIISHFIRGHINVLQHIKSAYPEEIGISTITQMEIEFGLRLNPDRAKKIQPVIESFLESINLLSFTKEDAKASAIIRAELQTQGKSIGPYDTLLAGCALARNLLFVTANTKEFQRVSGLKIEDWTLLHQ